MELGLSLGDTSKPISCANQNRSHEQKMTELGFCMIQDHQHNNRKLEKNCSSSSLDLPPLQLDLLPFSPPLHQSPPPPPTSIRPFPWLSQILAAEQGSQTKVGKGLDVKPLTMYNPENGEEPQSSPHDSNSDTSSFQMDFSSIFRTRSSTLPSKKRELENMDYLMDVWGRDQRRRGGISDEDENGAGRKKLRLTKEQSAFLEDSFKEHNTLNPKEKLVLANQLNLRPRQVEVWFQNRRARTKLKQTEVDCEYLKTCCETLTEENKRLQKELQELRALKTSHPFYMQPPPTTLTMCPSCERVVTTTTAATPPTTTALPAN